MKTIFVVMFHYKEDHNSVWSIDSIYSSCAEAMAYMEEQIRIDTHNDFRIEDHNLI